jgi:flavorubredoxin
MTCAGCSERPAQHAPFPIQQGDPVAHTTLFETANHKNVLLEDFSNGGFAVQANQHVIVHDNAAMILDPGGHKIYSKVMAATKTVLGPARLETIFLSHQDPDIVAAVNGWLMTTDATAYASKLWTRFIPHFGMDHLVADRLVGIPDEGTKLPLGSSHVIVVPAHFLHSAGNFHVYDPVSKILYSGDLGASMGADSTEVSDFDKHREYMDGFHRRYMASGRALKIWARTARKLDIEVIAPQHGALFRGKDMVARFFAWAEELQVGVDNMPEEYGIPA